MHLRLTNPFLLAALGFVAAAAAITVAERGSAPATAPAVVRAAR